jgi:heme-degrading monooxygenase HmoA
MRARAVRVGRRDTRSVNRFLSVGPVGGHGWSWRFVMFMRFVHLKVKKDRLADFARFYEARIIPALEGTPGCLYASLLQPTAGDDECISMTTWRSADAAIAYEKSGLYDELLDESDEYMVDAAEWKVRLVEERGSEPPALHDPDVESYPVEVAAVGEVVDATGPQRFFVRIVSARIEPGRFGELKERYDREIKPVLMETKGCRAVFLVESVKARSRVLSVTVWDSEEDAIRYELSGAFDKLIGRISEFFSGLYQWRLSLGGDQERDEITGKDLDRRGFKVVTGRRIES